MKKDFPINYGDKILLQSCKIETSEVFQGEILKFTTKWKLSERIPLYTKICYYLTDGSSQTIDFLDTEKSQSQGIFYSQMRKGEAFEDTISFHIPYNLKPGKYEINSFIFPTNDFKSNDGVNSVVWPEQKVVGRFNVKWQNDLKKKFSIYNNSKRSNFFNSLIEFWKKGGSLENNPNIYMWADFAFSTNARGARIIDILRRYTTIKDKRYLDVGCAYCGFLVAANLAGAKSVEGIDINGDLIELGKANLKDFEVKADVRVADILDNDYIGKKLEKFDLITCNDVIEHVLDPELAINNISKMLSRDGTVMFEIPNMNHPQFVRSDGHFSVFAITLLSREEAINYFRDSNGGDYSSVGFYHTIDTYKGFFKNSKLKFIIDPSTLEGVSKEQIEMNIEYLRKNLRMLISGVSEKYRALIKQKVHEYIKQFDKDHRKMSERDLLLYYGPAFWTVIGKKS